MCKSTVFTPRRRARMRPSIWEEMNLNGRVDDFFVDGYVLFTLERFSDAFLVLRAMRGGLPIALAPLVLIAMNVVHTLSAYRFDNFSDNVNQTPACLRLGLQP
jgi:hypothetical protein